jgi:ubiquitin carboxyl-terminal hydrolase 34
MQLQDADFVKEEYSLQIVLAHLGHIVWRHTNSDVFTETLLQLRRSVLACPTCCSIVLKVLATDDGALLNMLLRCMHAKVRSQIRSFFIDCLKVLREKEPVLYGLESAENDMDLDPSTLTSGILSDVMTKLRGIADESYMAVRGWDDFYLTLTHVVEMGNLETGILLDRGFLVFCLRLLCMHSYAQFQEDQPDLWRIVSKKSGIYNRFIGFVSTLLSRMDTRLQPISREDDRLAMLDRETSRFPLTYLERQILYYWDADLKAIAVLDKALEMFDETKLDHFHPGDIVKSMLGWQDAQVQTHLLKSIYDGVTLEAPFCDAYVKAALSYCESSPMVDNVYKIVTTVSKDVASTSKMDDDRLPGGLAVLDFFGGLLQTKHAAIFQQKHRYIFFAWIIAKSRTWAPPLLLHSQDSVRRGAHMLVCELYKSYEGWPLDLVHMRWRTLRETVTDMMKRIVYEKDHGISKSHLSPLIDTCHFLVQQLYDLNHGDDSELDAYRDVNDRARIAQWTAEIEPRLETWPQDDGLSAGDLYDHSDFGSESDVDDTHDNDL